MHRRSPFRIVCASPVDVVRPAYPECLTVACGHDKRHALCVSGHALGRRGFGVAEPFRAEAEPDNGGICGGLAVVAASAYEGGVQCSTVRAGEHVGVQPAAHTLAHRGKESAIG